MRLVLLGIAVLGFCAAGPVRAGDAQTQVNWVGDWDKAFAEAKKRECPVMVCINSKDGEIANERTARFYHNPDFVALSRKFVMVVVSLRVHATEGVCPRFGKITCEEHAACYKDLRARYGERIFLPGGRGEMATPQHIWIAPDGRILRRKEYELKGPELLKWMKEVLAESGKKGTGGDDTAGTDAPGTAEPGADTPSAPPTKKELADLDRLQHGKAEDRRAALSNLLASNKSSVLKLVLEAAQESKGDARCEFLAAFGQAQASGAREFVESCLNDRDDSVRSFAAVALEQMGSKDSIKPLRKRLRVERQLLVRKNLVRALGVCGGAAADKEAARDLLKAMSGPAVIARHAALALSSYRGEKASALVLPQLERDAINEKSPDLRAAILYTLAKIGNRKTTLPIFRKILSQTRIERDRVFILKAIDVLTGKAADFGRSSWWLFREDHKDPARRQ